MGPEHLVDPFCSSVLNLGTNFRMFRSNTNDFYIYSAKQDVYQSTLKRNFKSPSRD